MTSSVLSPAFKAFEMLKSRISSCLDWASLQNENQTEFSIINNNNSSKNYFQIKIENNNARNSSSIILNKLEIHLVAKWLNHFSNILHQVEFLISHQQQQQIQNHHDDKLLIDMLVNEFNSVPILFHFGKVDPRCDVKFISSFNHDENSNNSPLQFLTKLKGKITEVSPLLRTSTNPLFVECKFCHHCQIPSCLFEERTTNQTKTLSTLILPSFLSSNLISSSSSSSSSINSSNVGRRTFFICASCSKQQIFCVDHKQNISTRRFASTTCVVDCQYFGVQVYSSSFSQLKSNAEKIKKLDLVVFDPKSLLDRKKRSGRNFSCCLGQEISFSGFYCSSTRVMICHSIAIDDEEIIVKNKIRSDEAKNNNNDQSMQQQNQNQQQEEEGIPFEEILFNLIEIEQEISSSSSKSSNNFAPEISSHRQNALNRISMNLHLGQQQQEQSMLNDNRVISDRRNLMLTQLLLLCSCCDLLSSSCSNKNASPLVVMMLTSKNYRNNDQNNQDESTNHVENLIQLFKEKNDENEMLFHRQKKDESSLFPHWKTRRTVLPPSDSALMLSNSPNCFLSCGKLLASSSSSAIFISSSSSNQLNDLKSFSAFLLTGNFSFSAHFNVPSHNNNIHNSNSNSSTNGVLLGNQNIKILDQISCNNNQRQSFPLRPEENAADSIYCGNNVKLTKNKKMVLIGYPQDICMGDFGLFSSFVHEHQTSYLVCQQMNNNNNNENCESNNFDDNDRFIKQNLLLPSMMKGETKKTNLSLFALLKLARQEKQKIISEKNNSSSSSNILRIVQMNREISNIRQEHAQIHQNISETSSSLISSVRPLSFYMEMTLDFYHSVLALKRAMKKMVFSSSPAISAADDETARNQSVFLALELCRFALCPAQLFGSETTSNNFTSQQQQIPRNNNNNHNSLWNTNIPQRRTRATSSYNNFNTSKVVVPQKKYTIASFCEVVLQEIKNQTQIAGIVLDSDQKVLEIIKKLKNDNHGVATSSIVNYSPDQIMTRLHNHGFIIRTKNGWVGL